MPSACPEVSARRVCIALVFCRFEHPAVLALFLGLGPRIFEQQRPTFLSVAFMLLVGVGLLRIVCYNLKLGVGFLFLSRPPHEPSCS